jgi:hypothetical protein
LAITLAAELLKLGVGNMAQIAVTKSDSTKEEDGYNVETCEFNGQAVSRKASPDNYCLWLMAANVCAGSTLRWKPVHSDEVIYVKSGSLAVDRRTCSTGGMLIVERNAEVEAHALEDSELLHFGSTADASVTPRDGGRYHIIGPRGVFAHEDPTHFARIFADATCPTCSASMLISSRTQKYQSEPHSHTQDELIYLIGGDISLGSYHLDPGESIAIPANVRYRFESGDAGYRFLNFSADKSGYVSAPGAQRNPAAESRMVYTGDGTDYKPEP